MDCIQVVIVDLTLIAHASHIATLHNEPKSGRLHDLCFIQSLETCLWSQQWSTMGFFMVPTF